MDKLLFGSSSFTDRKISLKQAISLLAKNNIEVSDSEAAVILNFLYLIGRNYNKQKIPKKLGNLKGK